MCVYHEGYPSFSLRNDSSYQESEICWPASTVNRHDYGQIQESPLACLLCALIPSQWGRPGESSAAASSKMIITIVPPSCFWQCRKTNCTRTAGWRAEGYAARILRVWERRVGSRLSEFSILFVYSVRLRLSVSRDERGEGGGGPFWPLLLVHPFTCSAFMVTGTQISTPAAWNCF
jgi:hypothetical protein